MSKMSKRKDIFKKGQLRIRFLENEFWDINYQSIYKKWVQVSIK